MPNQQHRAPPFFQNTARETVWPTIRRKTSTADVLSGPLSRIRVHACAWDPSIGAAAPSGIVRPSQGGAPDSAQRLRVLWHGTCSQNTGQVAFHCQLWGGTENTQNGGGGTLCRHCVQGPWQRPISSRKKKGRETTVAATTGKKSCLCGALLSPRTTECQKEEGRGGSLRTATGTVLYK